MATRTETLRSGWTLDGLRIFLQHDPERGCYRLATRWRWLARFESIETACDAFEVMELSEGEPVALASHIKTEIRRNPRSRSAGSPHARLVYLADCAELRLQGLRPQSAGRRGAVIRWVPARTSQS